MVYRCKKCRRVVAGQTNIIPHIPKHIKIELAKKGIRPPPSKLTGLNCSENGQILIEKLKSLACQIIDNTTTGIQEKDPNSDEQHSSTQDSGSPEQSQSHRTDSNMQDSDEGPSSQVLDGYTEQNMVDNSIAARADAPEACRQMWFVEPMTWMKGVTNEANGKLHCPKCNTKIGSFSWVMGCKCPCGQKVAPAFYLVPSKVEWSNIVQNVQITV
ncbi:hypothetical protein O0L34_g12824 [Tuta absoluta]|nr:hypothetical protein O0L34_g12824 [Tuta absoluta]